jgi:hypothetical protein
LLCNRDERRARQAALPPFLQHCRGVRCIAPKDGDGGGSWIAINEAGLTFCLLNRYACGECCGPTKTDYRSRGLLLMELIDCQSLAEVQTEISGCNLEEFQPFTIVVLSPVKPVLLCSWDSHNLLFECDGDSAMPLISSSLDQKGVEACRKRLFQKLLAERGEPDVQTLFEFHRSHLPARSAYSPCMHRRDACTVSFSWITVAKDTIRFCYLPVAPCDHESLLRRNLDLAHFREILLERWACDRQPTCPSEPLALVMAATNKGGR